MRRYCPEVECPDGHAASCVSALPWTPQGCWPFKDSHWGELVHYIFTYINIGLCLVIMVATLVVRGAFNAEYSFIHRLMASVAILRFARTGTLRTPQLISSVLIDLLRSLVMEE